MYRAKITSKGQITIPVEVRKAMGIKPGEKIIFSQGAERTEYILRRAGTIMDMAGSLSDLAAPRSDVEMNRLLAAYAAELDDATKSNTRKSEKKAKMSDGEAA
jgi:antitoxin PrlF